MAKSKYRYNPVTCRYEAVPFGIRHILGRFILILLAGFFIFASLLLLHSSYYTTEKARALRIENNTMDYQLTRIKGELFSSKTSLTALQDLEKDVQRKLLVSAKQQKSKHTLQAKTDFNDNTFKKSIHNTNTKAKSLLQKAYHSNVYFGNKVVYSINDVNVISNIPSIQPIENKDLTLLATGYGMQKNPYHKGNYFHHGIDYVAPRGSPVLATAAGKVTEVNSSALPVGKGNLVTIDHGNGFKTRYTHLGLVSVKQGQRVTKGAQIAVIGLSGSSIAPHVHYEVLNNNRTVDPLHFLIEDVTSTGYAALTLLAKQKNQAFE